MTNLIEKYWPQYCRKNIVFLDEDQIVEDLIKKIRGSRNALTWWTLIEKIDLETFDRRNRKIIEKFYSINGKNPNFTTTKTHLDETQLRILIRVWEVLNQGNI